LSQQDDRALGALAGKYEFRVSNFPSSFLRLMFRCHCNYRHTALSSGCAMTLTLPVRRPSNADARSDIWTLRRFLKHHSSAIRLRCLCDLTLVRAIVQLLKEAKSSDDSSDSVIRLLIKRMTITERQAKSSRRCQVSHCVT